ncbi:hypothetical protein Q0590_25320 [Rhodocytophaga aerolata]|uniref:Transposase n=1 Tax=Rhodocytophaga aerolata TaxID=455078 RepID=A0ABT8REK2_9BACT|nr:hypothetical protein [Rhodocytophaga aerolata]MDO1449623.1 hypothetical protein [Rhodocytophaga aerolata]
MNQAIITRKLELAVIGQSAEKNQAWAFLRQLDREVFRAANQIISDQWFYSTFENKLVKSDALKIATMETLIEQEIKVLKEAGEDNKKRKEIEKNIEQAKKKRNELLKQARVEAREELKKFFEVSRSQLSYRMIAEQYKHWGSHVYGALIAKVNADFLNDYVSVVQGKRSIRNYKKGIPIPVRASSLRFEKDAENLYINWIKNIKFITVFGRDRSSRNTELDRLLSGEYDYGDSSLQIKGRKIFLLLSLKLPQKDTYLDPNKSLHVQAGIQVPVMCRVSGSEDHKLIGQADEILRKRMQFQTRNRNLQRALKDTVGGHGRGKKLQALDQIKEAERNWIRTYNHVLSKNVIAMCLKYNCGTILLEDIKELPKDEEEKKFYARNWAGFELKTMILQKAKVENIVVQLIQSDKEKNDGLIHEVEP